MLKYNLIRLIDLSIGAYFNVEFVVFDYDFPIWTCHYKFTAVKHERLILEVLAYLQSSPVYGKALSVGTIIPTEHKKYILNPRTLTMAHTSRQ